MDIKGTTSRQTPSILISPTLNTSSHEDVELCELARLAGFQLDPRVFKIILELIRLNVTPEAIIHLLKSITSLKNLKQ